MTYIGILAEEVFYPGFKGDKLQAYYARPAGIGPFPGVVVIHHMPGWDEWTCEVVRKLAHHGYAAVAPNLNSRLGPMPIEDAVAKVRAMGGPFDDQAMGDVAGSMAYLRAQSHATGKVGIIGFCSGGRQVYLAAGTVPGIDAVVDCWGGGVVYYDEKDKAPARPVAPIDYTSKITSPLLGLFGNEDHRPSPDEVNRIEAELKKYGKNYEFHRYDGAGHGFFAAYRPTYRQAQAADGWEKVYAFYAKYLGGQGGQTKAQGAEGDADCGCP